jgi:uncharacterized membrane protein
VLNLIPPDTHSLTLRQLPGTAVSQFPHLANGLSAALASPAGFAWEVWLPYLTGAVVLAAGLATVIKKKLPQERGLNKIIALGPVFLAVPLAVFGTEHFTAAKFLARIVPAWIPGHMFWAVFVGACLVSAALSIAIGKYARLAATLVGILLLLFVFLIHVPAIARAPGTRLLWVVGLRDLTFSGGMVSFAATHSEAWRERGTHRWVTLVRLLIGVVITFFGVEQLLHPELAPGVPLVMATPLWIPAHLLWGYLTGAVFIVTGLCLIINKEARRAAALLGLMILLLVLLVYVPIVVATISDIANGLNYLADTLLLSGSALALAGALGRDSTVAHQPQGQNPVKAGLVDSAEQ